MVRKSVELLIVKDLRDVINDFDEAINKIST